MRASKFRLTLRCLLLFTTILVGCESDQERSDRREAQQKAAQDAANDQIVQGEQDPPVKIKAPDPPVASRNFVDIQLPKNVSIQLPKNWVVLSGNQRITLDSAVESRLDLSGLHDINSEFPFAANLYDDAGKTIGMVNIRFYPDWSITQADVQTALPSDVADLDKQLRNQLQAAMAAASASLISWDGTRLQEYNGIVAFVSEYARSSTISPGNFRVRLVRVFAAERSFTLTVSYFEPAAYLLGPITDRIIWSLKMNSS